MTELDRKAMTEPQLIERCVANYPHAFEELDRRFRPRVYQYALRRLRAPEDAEDATQDAMIEVFRSLESFRGESALGSWIMGIARHQIFRRFRDRMRGPVSVDTPEIERVESPEVTAERKLDSHRVFRSCSAAAEKHLTTGQWNVFQLRYGENHSVKQIARETGKSTHAVKVILFRSREKLASHTRGLSSFMKTAS